MQISWEVTAVQFQSGGVAVSLTPCNMTGGIVEAGIFRPLLAAGQFTVQFNPVEGKEVKVGDKFSMDLIASDFRREPAVEEE